MHLYYTYINCERNRIATELWLCSIHAGEALKTSVNDLSLLFFPIKWRHTWYSWTRSHIYHLFYPTTIRLLVPPAILSSLLRVCLRLCTSMPTRTSSRLTLLSLEHTICALSAPWIKLVRSCKVLSELCVNGRNQVLALHVLQIIHGRRIAIDAIPD